MKKIIFLLSVVSLPVLANSYVNNGNPCVSDICIGDGIVELQKINWVDQREYKRKISDAEKNRLQSLYNNTIPDSFFSYFGKMRFDTSALQVIPKQSMYCGSDQKEFSGKYITENGNETEVLIKLMPAISGGNKQSWTVVKIKRLVKGNFSNEQIDSFRSQIKVRYTGFQELVGMSDGYLYSDKARINYDGTSTWLTINLTHAKIDDVPPTPNECAKQVNID